MSDILPSRPALHPGIQAMLDRVREAGIPAISAGSPAEARAIMAAGRLALGEPPAMRSREVLDIPTRAGRIPGVLLRPQGEIRGLLVYLHGGGWVIGAPADFEALGCALATQSGCAVLLPDYRLAPEHPFPAGLEDAEDALLWADGERTRLLGGSGGPLLAAGDSAGGNLVAVAAQTLRNRVRLAGQALIYPVTDADFARPSYAAYGDAGLVLTRRDMEWFLRHYAPPALWTDPRIAPLRASDLAGLPPATVVLAQCDVLHDEGAAYAARLQSAGIPVTLRDYPGVTHGFIRLHNLVDTAAQAVADVAADLRALCG